MKSEKIPMDVYYINDEESPSSRTTCEICKKKIKKGEMRVNMGGGVHRGSSARYHQKCFCKAMLPYIAMNVIEEKGKDDFDKEINSIFNLSILKNLKK